MDNFAIARVFAEIGDLLEIKNENPFKVRAYRNAAESIAHHPDRLADVPRSEWLAIPGIGRDLAAKIAEFDADRVFAAAAAHGVALEINSQPYRLDLDEHLARRARERGVKLMVNSDAHSPTALGNLRSGATVARRAWLEAGDVLNARPVDALRASLRRYRRKGGSVTRGREKGGRELR